MPRLSIIVPHRQDDLRLEETLVSVLENRPSDCEILVAHDGSYRDPYQLSNEVVFVETEAGSSVLRKINEATLASCAPTVHVVLDGVSVSQNWCESPLQFFADPSVGAVSPMIAVKLSSRLAYAGLSLETAGRRRLVPCRQETQNNLASHCLGPLLACGFYRRKMLLSLNGWLESVDSSVADVDLALALRSLGLNCRVDADCQVSAPRALVAPELTSAAVKQLASLAVAYGQIPPGIRSVATGGLFQLWRGKLLPSSWCKAFAWGIGVADSRFANRIHDRLQAAAERISLRTELSVPDHADSRAASSWQKPNNRQGELRKAA